jgi:hypothetical protein
LTRRSEEFRYLSLFVIKDASSSYQSREKSSDAVGRGDREETIGQRLRFGAEIAVIVQRMLERPNSNFKKGE